jgi:hypothetical protein
MGLIERLFGTWKTPRDLLADLAEDYRAESAQAARLRDQAERARYPQAAADLRRLADMEERHAVWLRERLLTLGAPVPAIERVQATGNNQWERAVGALHSAQAKRRRLVEQIAHWDPDEPEAVELLRRIEQEDLREQPVYEHLIMRSDPQSLD